MISNKLRHITWATSLIAAIIAGLCVYNMAYNPYGASFWLLTYVAIGLLSISVLVVGLTIFKSGFRVFGSVLTLVGILIPLAFTSLKLDYRDILFPETKVQLSKVEWQADLQQLADALKELHPNINAMISPEDLEAEVRRIDTGIEKWTALQIKLAFMKLVANIDDGHSIIPPQPAIDFHLLPFVTHSFENGIYIINAARDLPGLTNSQLTHIGGVPIEQAYSRIAKYIGTENDGNRLDRLPLYIGMTELLYEEGLSKSENSAEITIANELGETQTLTIEGRPWYQWALMYLTPQPKANALPYEHRLYAKHFWITHDELNHILYVNINNLKDDNDFSVEGFANHLKSTIENTPFDRLVLDVRQNRGGDNFKARSLVKVLQESPKVNRHGGLYVLTSRRTYSAATNFSSLLENQTQAIFVGEPTGQGPNQYGDAEGITLNNSRIWAAISRVTWRGSFKLDSRDAVKPHLPVTYQFIDYLEGNDPAINAVLNHKPGPQTKAYAGDLTLQRYVSDEGQLIWFEKNTQDQWQLIVDDFSDISLNKIITPVLGTKANLTTPLRFLDIAINDDHLELTIENTPVTLTAVNTTYTTPFQDLYSDDLDRMKLAVERFKKHPEYKFLFKAGRYKIRGLGYHYYDNNQPQKAISVFELIRFLEPEYTYSWSRLAYAQLRTGDVQSAIANFQTALELNPNNTNAANMMMRLQQEIK